MVTSGYWGLGLGLIWEGHTTQGVSTVHFLEEVGGLQVFVLLLELTYISHIISYASTQITKEEKNNSTGSCHFPNSNNQRLLPELFLNLPSLHRYLRLFGEASHSPALPQHVLLSKPSTLPAAAPQIKQKVHTLSFKLP